MAKAVGHVLSRALIRVIQRVPGFCFRPGLCYRVLWSLDGVRSLTFSLPGGRKIAVVYGLVVGFPVKVSSYDGVSSEKSELCAPGAIADGFQRDGGMSESGCGRVLSWSDGSGKSGGFEDPLRCGDPDFSYMRHI